MQFKKKIVGGLTQNYSLLEIDTVSEPLIRPEHRLTVKVCRDAGTQRIPRGQQLTKVKY